MAVNMAGKD